MCLPLLCCLPHPSIHLSHPEEICTKCDIPRCDEMRRPGQPARILRRDVSHKNTGEQRQKNQFHTREYTSSMSSHTAGLAIIIINRSIDRHHFILWPSRQIPITSHKVRYIIFRLFHLISSLLSCPGLSPSVSAYDANPAQHTRYKQVPTYYW